MQLSVAHIASVGVCGGGYRDNAWTCGGAGMVCVCVCVETYLQSIDISDHVVINLQRPTCLHK